MKKYNYNEQYSFRLYRCTYHVTCKIFTRHVVFKHVRTARGFKVLQTARDRVRVRILSQYSLLIFMILAFSYDGPIKPI